MNNNRLEYFQYMLEEFLNFSSYEREIDKLNVVVFFHEQSGCQLLVPKKAFVDSVELMEYAMTLDAFEILSKDSFAQTLEKAKNYYFAKEHGKNILCDHCGGSHLKLMPDFESSALWCNSCGVEIFYSDTNLPKEAIEEIIEWNNLWCETNLSGAKKGFNLKGLEIALKIKKYHSCSLFIVEEVDENV